jgi:spermidine/putrescine transport system ATP-binding protein
MSMRASTTKEDPVSTGGNIKLEQLTKQFADVAAVDHIDLDIGSGEFFSLLGPSGCGKTTTLRMVAGFEAPTGGGIYLDGHEVSHLPPNRRNVNTVFQSYALFPFATVAANVAFGLKYHHLSKTETTRMVGEILELVQLTGMEKRKPNQLSGGQQQRVALARALVLKPAVLLLDEPLGALDAKLRRSLQVELKALQEQIGITFLFVTHDQEEALTMSDRLAVMSKGRIAQLGTPQEVYEEPVNAYVADFLGVSNLLDALVVHAGGTTGPCELKVGDFTLLAGCGAVTATGPVKLAIRPERVQLAEHGAPGANHLPGMVERTVFLGSANQVHVRLATGEKLQALIHNDGQPLTWSQGTPVTVGLEAAALRVLPTDDLPVPVDPVLGEDPAPVTVPALDPAGSGRS